MLVVAASGSADPSAMVSANLKRLREASAALTVVPLANVAWDGPPLEIANGVIGSLDQEFLVLLRSSPGAPPELESDRGREWLRQQTELEAPSRSGSQTRRVVAAAHWTQAQQQSAVDQSQRWVENVCNVALLLEPDLEALGLWSLRGSHNRPGVRGLVRDHSALVRLLEDDPEGRFEISSELFVASVEFPNFMPVQWYSPDPFPLKRLLADASRIKLVQDVVLGESAIYRRLRVAARWHAEAHWANDPDDAALALGVALDALIGSRSGLPGRAMAQRFAYLDGDPSNRRSLVARYNEVFGVRSAIAHGGRSSKIKEPDFVRSIASDVRWASRRLILLGLGFSVSNEDELEAAFNSLALGEIVWPS